MFKWHYRHHRLIQRAYANLRQQRFFIAVGKPGGASLTIRLRFIGFFRTRKSDRPY